jgi:DNA-nicking Smr family endonuclease
MSKKKKGQLSAEDAALWDSVNEDVQPLHKGKARPLAPPTPKRASGLTSRREKMMDLPPQDLIPPKNPRTGASTQTVMASGTAIDGSRARKMRKGQLPIEGRVDLHGMTQAHAHHVLNNFITQSQAQGKKCILVITGKGGIEIQDPDNVFATKRTGVLRHAVPGWLAQGDNARRVLAWHPARPNHGGDGALYVVLKRLR